MQKLILHIPHSATNIPLRKGYCVSDELLNQEILKLTDWYTDDLFENETDVIVKAPFSRIFCDVERFSDDSREIMAQFGMGVLYETTDTGKTLRMVTPELRKIILDNYYWNHHNRLTERVQLQLEQWGRAIIVDCHSFPHQPHRRALDQSGFRPDFNIGTDDFHTPQGWKEASKPFFEEKGFTVGIDQPYSGSIVPMDYYQKDKNVHSIMLEINRRLYLQEPTNEKSNQYQQTKQAVQEFLNLIREMD